MQIAQDNATAGRALGAALVEEGAAARSPYSEYKVIRRNGAVVGFEPAKISVAMTKAFLAVNGAAMRLYGYSKEEFLSMTADQIRPQEDVEDLRKAFEDRSRNYRQRVWRHRKKNGELIQVKVISFNLDFDGRAARLGVIHDMTEQLNAEERARQTEERYLALLRERQGG